MKRILLCLTAFMLSWNVVDAQEVNVKGVLKAQRNTNAKVASPMKAPRRIELADGQNLFGAYVSDALADVKNSIGMPRYTGNNKMGTIWTEDLVRYIDGMKVVKVRFGLSSSVGASRVFITPLNAQGQLLNDVVSQSVASTTAGWNEVTLDAPYTVDLTGVAGFLVGYDYKQVDTNDGQYYNDECFPISMVNEGLTTYTTLCYLTYNGQTGWYDIGAGEYGNLSIQLVVEGQFPNDGLKTIDFGEVFRKVGESSDANIHVQNCGGNAVENVSYIMTTNGVDAEEVTYTFDEPLTKFGQTGVIALPLTNDDATGELAKKITFTKVNGNANNEAANVAEGILTTLPDVQVNRNVLIEECTGTGCGWCPRGMLAMDQIAEHYGDRAVGIALHWYSKNANEVMYLNLGNYAELPLSYGAPACLVNRGDEMDPKYGSKQTSIYNDIDAAMTEITKGTIDVEGKWNSDFTQVDATATINSLIDKDNYEVEFVLVANGLTGTTAQWNQSNYYYQYTAAQVGDYDLAMFCKGGEYGQASIKGWKFNDVAIAGCFSQNVNQVPLVSAKAGEPTTVSYTLTLPTKVALKNAIQKDNVYVAAILVDGYTGKVQNAVKVKVPYGEGSGIEMNETLQQEETRYGLDGTLLDSPKKGVNIIRMSNGEIRKVIVK